jgi:threonine dehydrogenase-like Zn-dependent dehydrogenase
MRAAIFNGPYEITVGKRPDPIIENPTDAIVRVVLSCVCGSDLWYYRGASPHAVGSIGHEFIGLVEDLGAEVTGLAEGDLVVAPFVYCDMSCPHCKAGATFACLRGGSFGNGEIDGGQGEAVRVPLAASSLVKVPGSAGDHSEQTLRSLLALSDVMCTGHHAAVCGRVKKGDTVAVVGDGAVGLSAVLASKRFGAERIIALSGNPVRQDLAREFGATDILPQRGDDAVSAVMELTDGIGVDGALECVGTGQSAATAMAIARPGSTVGIIGAPHGVDIPFEPNFWRGVGWHGSVAPARAYIPELLPDVLDDRINPGRVFDYETDLDHLAEAYAAMDERRAIKSLIRVASI